MRPAVFTICSNLHVAQASVLLDSVGRFLPDARRFLVLADALHPGVPYPAGCDIILAHELGIGNFNNFAFRYARREFEAALKPFAFQRILGMERHSFCLYFDPDIELFSPISAVRDAFIGGASFALTPHVLFPAETMEGPDDVSFLRDGTYNLGFLGVGDTQEAHKLLAWWGRWLRWDCVDDRSIGFFIDQKFIDLLPGFVSNLCLLHEPSLNVAYWNLTQRAFTPSSSEGPLVDGERLGFFHYSGFDPDEPGRLSRDITLFAGDTLPASWRDFLGSYAARVKQAGYGCVPEGSYAYERFASGVPIPDMVRRMFRNDYDAWAGNPFDNFESWSHLPARDAVLGVGSALPSFMMQWLQARHPALASMRLSDPDGVARLTRWWLEHGISAGLDRRYLEPQALAAGKRPIRLEACRPPPHRHRIDVSVIRPSADEGSAGQLGLGLLASMSLACDRVEDLAIDAGGMWKASGRITLVCTEADQLAPFLDAEAHRLPQPSYRVYVPASELRDTSDAFRLAMSQFDEIWAPTRFWQSELVLQADIPVLHMPGLWRFPKRPSRLAQNSIGRPYILAEPDRFAGFGELLAALKAYEAAFGGLPSANRPALVIPKGNGGAWHDAMQGALSRAEDVILVDAPTTPVEAIGRVAGAACVLALHRGEALGISVARAFAYGVPVVATDFGGCTDLLTPQTGFPVRARIRSEAIANEPERQRSPAVQADVNHAAWSLREVFDHSEEAQRRAANGMVALEATSSLAAVTSRQSTRLMSLGLLASSGLQSSKIDGEVHV